MFEESTIWAAGVWCLVGWVVGLVFGLSLRWPESQYGEVRRLRAQLKESDRQVSAGFATADRMAAMLAEQAARESRR